MVFPVQFRRHCHDLGITSVGDGGAEDFWTAVQQTGHFGGRKETKQYVQQYARFHHSDLHISLGSLQKNCSFLRKEYFSMDGVTFLFQLLIF